jgi:hypothetical protein
MANTHTESEDHAWSVNISDHPMRTESPAFVSAKKAAKKILATMPSHEPYGAGPWEMHHGGSLWVYDGQQWKLFLARAGIEWSMQFCGDPAKVELLRQDAVSLIDAFSGTRKALADIGYKDIARLDTPIVTADDVAWYTDSLFNSCVPLDRLKHQGILPSGAGKHHYPEPIVAAENFKVDSFELFVALPGGGHAAVAPVSPTGSGDGRVRVLYATPGTSLNDEVVKAQEEKKAVIVPADHPIAQATFVNQQG